jgi:hypothetical protein
VTARLPWQEWEKVSLWLHDSIRWKTKDLWPKPDDNSESAAPKELENVQTLARMFATYEEEVDARTLSNEEDGIAKCDVVWKVGSLPEEWWWELDVRATASRGWRGWVQRLC